MNEPVKRARDLGDLLADWQSEPLEPASANERQPERQIEAIAGALRVAAERRRRRSRFTRIAAACAVAASVLAIGVGGWMLRDEGRSAEASGAVKLVLAQGPLELLDARGQRLPESAHIGEGVEIETAAGQAELGFASGARAALAGHTRLRIAEAGAAGRETVVLGRGRVDVEVPKSSAPVVFSVKTPDALVVVHGTRFSVAVDPLATAGQTRVDVTRGVVVVHAGGEQVRLVAGDQWPQATPSDRAAVTPPPQPPFPLPAPIEAAARSSRLHGAEAGSPARRASAARHKAKARRSAPVTRHQLALENRLFATAMEQKKAGETARALGSIEAFIARHPDSVLMQEARVERFRLLARLGRASEAAHHARQYLGDYRDGYARDEARDVALGAP